MSGSTLIQPPFWFSQILTTGSTDSAKFLLISRIIAHSFDHFSLNSLEDGWRLYRIIKRPQLQRKFSRVVVVSSWPVKRRYRKLCDWLGMESCIYSTLPSIWYVRKLKVNIDLFILYVTSYSIDILIALLVADKRQLKSKLSTIGRIGWYRVSLHRHSIYNTYTNT